MTLFALGLNHQTAAIAERECLAQSLCFRENFAQDMIKERAIEEAVILSTCNRTEVYTVTKCHHAVKAWMRRKLAQESAPLINKLYEHHEVSMIKHLMSVASGVESMVVGEPQILGQIKGSYQTAMEAGTVGPQFRNLFPAVFEVAKLVRTQTQIGENPVTLTYAVIQLAKQIFSDLAKTRVLLIGAGETTELMANYFAQHGVAHMYIANRTLTNAHNLARRYKGMPIRLEELSQVLADVDLIISATSAPHPILAKKQLEQAQHKKQKRSLFIADLALPRDVAPEVAELPNVHLFNLDDLQAVIDKNLKTRAQACAQARAIIEVQASHYLRQLRVIDAGDMIRSFRQKMESWRDVELTKALKHLKNRQDPELVLREFARNLTNKFMHEPTTKLRDAAYAEHEALMGLLQELYEL